MVDRLAADSRDRAVAVRTHEKAEPERPQRVVHVERERRPAAAPHACESRSTRRRWDRLAGGDRVEQRRDDRMKHLRVSRRVGVDGLGEKAARPPAVPVIDGAEEVDARDVPCVHQQVHATDVSVLELGEIASGVVQSDDRLNAAFARPPNERLHAVDELQREGVARVLRGPRSGGNPRRARTA